MINRRYQKVLTDRDLRLLKQESGPLFIERLESYYPVITRITDSEGTRTYHYMYRDIVRALEEESISDLLIKLPSTTWSKTDFITISYQTSYGTPPFSKLVPLINGKYTLQESDFPDVPYDGNKVIDSWNDSEGSPVQVGDVIEDDITLVAHWVDAWTITYLSSKGTAPTPKKVVPINGEYELTEDDLPGIPFIDYEISSWMLNGESVSVGDIIEGNVTLVAEWVRKEAGQNDYLFSDGTYSEILQEGKTPIAIGIHKGSQMPDGIPRWISLKNMSMTNPENGTSERGNSEGNPGACICWGAYGLVRKYWNKVPLYGWNKSTNEFYHEVRYIGDYCFCGIQFSDPSDDFKDYFLEIDTKYHIWIPNDNYDRDSTYNPCFLTRSHDLDSRLQVTEFEGNSFNNPLTDFDGKGNTTAIISQTIKYLTGTIEGDDWSEGSYPAATACYRYGIPYAVCIKDNVEIRFATYHEWYLPSLGELMGVTSRLSTINEKLQGAIDRGFDAVPIGNYDTSDVPNDGIEGLGRWLWSSSECSETQSLGLHTNEGSIAWDHRITYSKYTRVRAFLKFIPIDS